LTEIITSTQRIYDGKILNLRVDTVDLDNGKSGKREIVEHHGAIAVVPLYDDGTVVMVKQFRLAAGRTMLEIPAGSVEPGEKELATAHRELAEEVHLQAAEMTKLFQSFVAPGYSTELIHTYLARSLSENTLPGDEDEDLHIVRMPLGEAIAKISSGEIEDSKSIAGLLYVNQLIEKGFTS
jgi:ADP-ribose pyrophosphatase